MSGRVTKIQKLARAINDQFREALPKAFAERFGVHIDTEWNIIHLRLASFRADGKPLTKEQRAFISGFEAGYSAAAGQIK